jgi:hypothetical protein
MKIDFSQVLTDLEGQPLKWLDYRDSFVQVLQIAAQQEIITPEQFAKIREMIGAKEDDAPLTLERLTVSALLMVKDKEQGDVGKAKYERHKLIQKIHKAKRPVTISSEQVTALKEAVGNSTFNCWVTGQGWDLLEGTKPADDEEDAETPVGAETASDVG